jgi:prophage antirepressor-like protein
MTERTITPFLWEGEITVRVTIIDGAPWFVATDVCRALGLTDPAETVKVLDNDEKGISNTDTLGGFQEAITISESGLFTLIFRSRKPHAIRFRKWVTGEVLPAIRRTGRYSNDNAAGAPTASKRYPDWSLDETRVAIALVNAARGASSQGAAAWVWQHVGLPMPPKKLLAAWAQADLFSEKDAA